MNMAENHLPPGSAFDNLEVGFMDETQVRVYPETQTEHKTDRKHNGQALQGKIYFIPADKKHKPILFDDLPTAKGHTCFHPLSVILNPHPSWPP